MNDISYEKIDYHLVNDEKPSEYLNSILYEEKFKEYPFIMLYKLKGTEQSPKHHPEGDVWNHTMLVVDAAANLKGNSKDTKVLMWAALLHDIGKPDTTKVRKGKITSYNHDKLGAKLSEEFLITFIDDHEFIVRVSSMIRWHMQLLFVLNNYSFANINEMKREVDVEEIAILGLCDRLGRAGADTKEELYNIRRFLNKVSKTNHH